MKKQKRRAALAAKIASIVGIIAIAAMIGFSLAACGDGGGGGGGSGTGGTSTKTVTVGAQNGTLFAGKEGFTEYPVTTANIADGFYEVTVANLPSGVTSYNVTISGNSGKLLLEADTSTTEATTSDLTLTLDGVTSAEFAIAIVVKTVTVGEQDITPTERWGTTVSFSVTTANIANGKYDVTVDNLPNGVTVYAPSGWSYVEIIDNYGYLVLMVSGAAATTSNLTLTLDDVTSAEFTITIDHPDYVWTVTSTTYPAQSIQICPVCNATKGTARDTIIGDGGPGGGTVFYVADREDGITIQGYTGETGSFDEYTAYYLEATTSNNWRFIAWASSAYASTDITGTGTGIGTGRANTAAILAVDASAPAARACKNYTGGGKDDWFLPSKDELNEIYKAGIRSSGYYWSSSQDSSNRAWYQNFESGFQFGSNKSTTYVGDVIYVVFAVRAF